MKLIKPSQISGEIMTLIEEADEKLIVVSPYYKLSNWTKLLKRIDGLKTKEIPVKFYVRAKEKKSIDEIERLDFTPLEVPNLHTKLYINEKYAIVSSMNLLSSSDEQSIDIAYKTSTKREYQELIEYYERFVKSKCISHDYYDNLEHHKQIQKGSWKNYLKSKLVLSIGDMVDRVSLSKGKLTANCNNNHYEASIENSEEGNSLIVSAILTKKQFDLLQNKIDVFKTKSNLLVYTKSDVDGYNKVFYTSEPRLKSESLKELVESDYNFVVQVVFDFVVTVHDLKQNGYKW